MPFTTELLYLNDTYQFDGKANLLSIGSDENGSYLVLDRTIFYPQGGAVGYRDYFNQKSTLFY